LLAAATGAAADEQAIASTINLMKFFMKKPVEN